MSNTIVRSPGEPRQTCPKHPYRIKNEPETPARLCYDDCRGCKTRITVSRLDLWEVNRNGALIERIGAVHLTCVGKAKQSLLPLPTEAFTPAEAEKRKQEQRARRRLLFSPGYAPAVGIA